MEYRDIQNILFNSKLRDFIVSSLRESMTNLGFSKLLIDDLLKNISSLNTDGFIENHKDELRRVQLEHFFDELVPAYFKNNVIPEIPETGKVFDLGCGRGTLIKSLIERNKNQEIVGVDIKPAQEWANLVSGNVRLEVVSESNFLAFLEKEKPDIVTATWTFHHMDYEEQKRYLVSLYGALKTGVGLVVLEDSYSEKLSPESGESLHKAFMDWGREDRNKIIGVLDWIANRIFSMRTTMPVPFAYRTLEEWEKIFIETGFTVRKTRFLGFPDGRDVNTPQSLLVISK